MTKYDWLITATPPTPNGDLHVGHMSGPYLSADIFKRTRLVLGDSAVYVCYGDDHQSYVTTTAKRLDTDPVELMDKGNADIKKTLDAYRIDMDQYTRPDNGHNKFVGDAIRQLINKNLIVEKTVAQLCDGGTGFPIYEAFATGYCNVCLAETKGGICESCGHPNDPVDLLQKPFNNGNNTHCIKKSTRRLVLPIEDYREDIIEFYKTKRGVWRPHLIQLVDELLSKPLADYPISHPSKWGIPIGVPKWNDHVINVWAEMGLGLIYLLNQHRSKTAMEQGRYVQFLGYDNSYFFAIVHPVLQFALKRAGVEFTKVPEFIFTNEFYHLDNKKFSTSQGHALWGRDFLEHVSVDEARLYLSLHSPELSEKNFQLNEAKAFIKSLRVSLKRINSIVAPTISDIKPDNVDHKIKKSIEDRIKFFCQPEHFSSRALAQIIYSIITYLSDAELNLANNDTLKQVHSLHAVFQKYAVIFMNDYGK
ncbi:MAG: class I tRNA ligase family protein [Candidatus Halichondribacter symbioticus]